MTLSILLAVHILGGIVSLGWCVGGMVAVIKKRTNAYSWILAGIRFLAAGEIVSGLGVVMLSAKNGELVSFCAKIVIYLAIMAGVYSAIRFQSGVNYGQIKSGN